MKNNKQVKNKKITLSDDGKKQQNASSKGKLAGLAGKKWDDLKAKEKDDILKSIAEQFGLIDAGGAVI